MPTHNQNAVANKVLVSLVEKPPQKPVVLQEVARERAQSALSQDFDALYRDYKRKVFGTVRNVVGPCQELEDIVQTVFLEIHRSLPRYRGTAQLSTWIYRIAVNVSLQHIRKRKRSRLFLFLGDDARRDARYNHDPRTRLAERERIEVLYRLVDKLSEKKRTTFILYEMEGMTVEDIAAICEVPVNTVRSRLIAARAQLTQRMRSAGLLEPSS